MDNVFHPAQLPVLLWEDGYNVWMWSLWIQISDTKYDCKHSVTWICPWSKKYIFARHVEIDQPERTLYEYTKNLFTEERNLLVTHVITSLEKTKILKIHKQSVHGVKKCTCKTCDDRFNLKGSMIWHVKFVHDACGMCTSSNACGLILHAFYSSTIHVLVYLRKDQTKKVVNITK